jgi:bifunctional non-homologous end joining protein LigD
MIKPMLCGLKAPSSLAIDMNRLWERKYDGERLTVDIQGTKKFMYARSGREKARMYPDLQIETLTDCVLDGEVVATTGKFNDIQHRANRESGIKEAAKQYPVVYMVFDVIKIAGLDTLNLPLHERKGYLEELISPNPTCQIVPVSSNGYELWERARAEGWEGIIGKKLHSHYSPGARGEDWIKVKCLQRGEFWVVGFTQGTGWRASTFGSLILADISPTKVLVPVGEVGTGFDQREIERINAKIKSTIMPVQTPIVTGYNGGATWIAPFKVTVEFLEKTADGKIRFPSYKGEV